MNKFYFFFLLLFIPLGNLFPQEQNLSNGKYPVRANPDIEKLRKEFTSDLLASPVNESRISELMTTLRPDGSWPGIDYVDTSRIAFQHAVHLANLVQMSRAYKKPESKLHGNKELKKNIQLALDFWLKNDFICENWWNNEIGTPSELTAVLLIMDKDLTAEQIEKTSVITFRANINAPGARPSGDRIKIIGLQAKNALFKRDVPQFEMLIKAIEGEIKFATDTERGIQYDYSFHHRPDRVNNTLSYGTGYADAYAEWAAKVATTRYRFSETSLELLTDYYLDGICKQRAFGRFDAPGTDNRDIARFRRGTGGDAHLAERLLAAGSYRKEELQEIIHICRDGAKPTLSFGKFFWQTEYYVHQRPDYYTTVRMFSSRNMNMEEPYNGEGLMNHHRADGANYLSLTGAEYLNLAPVNDWQKIPGATILQKPALPSENEIQKAGVMDFVGAVTDDMYGAVAFDFISPHDPLKARKSWFFFDKEYVCLGAGITSGTNQPIVTTLNQCFLNGDVTIGGGDGKAHILPKGEHPYSDLSWVFHDGVGYIFPDSAKVVLSNYEQTGSWYLVNHQTHISKDEVRKEVFKLWINHGRRAQNATYQYIVMPAANQREVEIAAKSPDVEILSNTPFIQAVWQRKLHIFQAVFYKSGEVRLADGLQVSIDTPG
ncbi:MAG: polysaccharide lyase beta-sandwich domain-containing protein, partial [Candidatus Symbiothrix sp.]|nr:polysaccharide lyase beta-sandwich domain-containing protein [Candidatus Symbiothrix sp.]